LAIRPQDVQRGVGLSASLVSYYVEKLSEKGFMKDEQKGAQGQYSFIQPTNPTAYSHPRHSVTACHSFYSFIHLQTRLRLYLHTHTKCEGEERAS